jgi:uncharacterized protein YegP (UPF0339 family)
VSARSPRFEVVQSDAGWFARFRAANGRIVFVSEVYTRERAAERAMWLVRDSAIRHYEGRADIEVRTVDERTAVQS